MEAVNAAHWWYDYFKDVDSGDIDKFATWFADDIVVRFGNQPVVRGKASLVASFRDFFKNFMAIKHTHGTLFTAGNLAAGEGVVTYTKHNGRQISIPVTSIIEYRDGLVRRLSVYIDLGPLFAPDEANVEIAEPLLFVN